jgi:hypothetical protein
LSTARFAVALGDVPKSFPKTPYDAAGSQRSFGLLIFFRMLVVGAPGLEPGAPTLRAGELSTEGNFSDFFYDIRVERLQQSPMRPLFYPTPK